MHINRASQFMPFDSLKGFNEMLRLIEKEEKQKKYLDSDYQERLNNILINLKANNKVKLKYFYLDEYLETEGLIKKIDKDNKLIYLENTIIDIDNIIYIEIL